ncbi:MAG TPA: LptE family protein [Chitinophagaceae bacterium]|nr:LptE family protein [Chitinophagaceae bacterium]
MPTTKKIIPVIFLGMAMAAASMISSCKVHYGFKDITIPPDISTVKVNFIENRAPYINPQLSPQLTDKLRQKIVSQTRLKQTNGDNADWEITGTITDYSFSTSGISNNQTTTNRINVAVHLTLNDQKAGKTKEYNVSRSFDFSSGQSLQQAESVLLPDMIKGMADDIFNQIFSNW